MTDYNLVESIRPASEELEAALKCNEIICITGPPAVGKTTMTRVVLDRNKDQFVSCFIDCYDVATPTQLYTNICSGLNSSLNISKERDGGKLINSFQPNKQTVLGQDFPNYCKEYYHVAGQKSFEKIFIVLDHIESFRGTSMMDSVALLLTVRYINIIWITTRSPTDIIMYISNSSPGMSLVAQDKSLPIYVGCWSRADIIQVIMNSEPRTQVQLYKTFVNNVVNLVYTTNTKSVRDIKLYCQENFEHFLEFYQEKVQEKIRKDFGTDGDSDDSFEITTSITVNIIRSFLQSLKSMVRQYGLSSYNSEAQEKRIKLPVNTATLLVAAYIAAQTKLSDDRRNFVKCQKKSSKREGTRGHWDKKSKQFTLERLLHIYLSLLRMSDGKVGGELHLIQNNDNILSDIERLENLNILKVCGGDGLSSDTKYKLSSYIRRDYINKLAAHANINLDYIHGL